MDSGFKSKQFHKSRALIDEIKNLGSNLKYGINIGPFYEVSPKRFMMPKM